ncbi:MAG: sugar phosphorylase [Pseudomonadales bacterium]
MSSNENSAPPRLKGTVPTGLTDQDSTLPDSAVEYQLRVALADLYGAGSAEVLARRLLQMVRAAAPANGVREAAGALSERDQLLITYGDTVQDAGKRPLAALKQFADEHLTPAISAVHVLPFFPFSSDDGFAVIDYTEVRPDLGEWGDINALSERFELMFDLVINHCSREHLWFADFVGDRAPGRDYFITMDDQPDADLSAVVRPRNTPLLSSVRTYAGERQVWTTFSDDQVDLNFANPDVLCRFVEILLLYVQQGARLVRLDAIAFLWKRVGTRCSSLAETHTVVRILRMLLDACHANVRLLTETNVPHAENISYFGNRDEAQLVYQFSLAPLLLYSYLFNDGTDLGRWAQALTPPPEGCSYLNFIASHDGIGMRPLEGLVSEARTAALIELVRERGGFVSLRQLPDGTERVYEINSALFSAFGGQETDIPAYVGAHQLLLGFQGVPALYLNALVGTNNDIAGVERTGRTRSINRGQWQLDQLRAELGDGASSHGRIYGQLMHALAVRRQQPAFSPEAGQRVLASEPGALILLRESNTAHGQRILVVASFLHEQQTIAWPTLDTVDSAGFQMPAAVADLLTGQQVSSSRAITLAAYQVLWLELVAP